jgi:phosphoglycolate/pyridoxal phosphate phosphatase family enzyme
MSTTQNRIPLFDGYIFDLDGTVYLGDKLLPGAGETILRLRELGRKVVFLSNNPTHTRQEYSDRLTRMGLPTPIEEVISSAQILVQWLVDEAPNSTVFPIAEQPLQDELLAHGFRFSEKPDEIEFVIASFDRTFNYHKLQVAFDAMRAGARLIATNADRYCPVPGGGQPDAAAIIAAIEASSSTKLEIVTGKPSAVAAQTVANMLKLPPERCIMTGDRLETDIEMGVKAGMHTALTLTGASTRDLIETLNIHPTYVINGLHELIEGAEL